MGSTGEFVHGAQELEAAKAMRRRPGRPLRGATGITYGLAAYGSPIGAVTGVQVPAPAAVEMPMQTEQFSGTSDGGTSL